MNNNDTHCIKYIDSAKARSINQLRQEAADMRAKQRDYRAL